MKKPTTTLEIEKARRLALRALTKSGAVRANVRYLADAVVDSELVGMPSHGFFWLPVYCSHLRCGKVDGVIKPVITRLIHACGMVEIADRLVFSDAAAIAGSKA